LKKKSPNKTRQAVKTEKSEKGTIETRIGKWEGYGEGESDRCSSINPQFQEEREKELLRTMWGQHRRIDPRGCPRKEFEDELERHLRLIRQPSAEKDDRESRETPIANPGKRELERGWCFTPNQEKGEGGCHK